MSESLLSDRRRVSYPAMAYARHTRRYPPCRGTGAVAPSIYRFYELRLRLPVPARLHRQPPRAVSAAVRE